MDHAGLLSEDKAIRGILMAHEENLEYVPGPPPAPGSTPEQVTRAVWEELERIAAALLPTAHS